MRKQCILKGWKSFGKKEKIRVESSGKKEKKGMSEMWLALQ